MHMIKNQEHKIRSPNSQFQSLFIYLISRSMAVFMLFVLFLLWCLRVDFSGFSISNSSFSLGRTHMFLVCNGIVLILVKISVLSTPDEAGDGQNLVNKKKNAEKVEVDFEVLDEKHAKTGEIAVSIEEVEEAGQKISNGCDLIAELEQTDQQSVDEEEQGIEEEKEEDGIEELSVDELNKKCDEFIRRMRSVISNANGFF